jgi:hypothetical protein
VKDGRRLEAEALHEGQANSQKAWDDEDKRYLKPLPFRERLLIKLSMKRTAVFTRQVIIAAFSRGIISEQQARVMARSVDSRLWPDGRK